MLELDGVSAVRLSAAQLRREPHGACPARWLLRSVAALLCSGWVATGVALVTQ